MKERILRVNQLIKKELSQMLSKEIDFPKNVLVTLTRVETSPDLAQAKVYISVIPEKEEENVFNVLKKHISSLQKKLNKKLSMKFVPKIIFVEEKTTKEAGRIEELLEEIKKKQHEKRVEREF